MPVMPTLSDDDSDNGECQLMGPFAILVQLGLATIALLALLLKRRREHPPRPFQVWFVPTLLRLFNLDRAFDVSKQMIGALELHFTNILLSDIASSLGADSVKLHPNRCVWCYCLF